MKKLIYPRNLKDLLWIQRIKIILVLGFIAQVFILLFDSHKRVIPSSLILLFSEFRRKPVLSRFSIYSVTLFSISNYFGA